MSHICVTHKMWLQRTQMTFSSPQINLIVLSLSWWQELRLTGNFYYLIHCGISVHICSRLYYISFKQIKVGGKKKKNDYTIFHMYVVPDELFECKTAARCTQVISMPVISILLRSLEQINTCSTFAESLMPNCLLSPRAETAVKCSPQQAKVS